LIVMKGLPLAYQKDMQEDKHGRDGKRSPRFFSLANSRHETGMVADMVPERGPRMKLAGR